MNPSTLGGAATPPLISVLMPVRNEERHIAQAVESVARNGYPLERLEIIVIDGDSDDATPAILAGLQERLPLKVLSNPRRNVPTAMNIGWAAARGEIIFRLDGHASFQPGFLWRALDFLGRNPNYHCVGAPIRTISDAPAGRAIALAQSSPFGVGNSSFRTQGHEGEVDSVAFGAYRRQVFDQIGGFDEELVRNQDDEFNYRMRRHGMRLWMLPEIGSSYVARACYRSLWRQYFQYGFWKIRVMQKLGEVPSLRSIVPLGFCLALGAGLVLAPWNAWPLGLLLVAYLLFLGSAAWRAQGQPAGARAGMVWAVVVLHFSYGLGELAGIRHFVLGPWALRLLNRQSRPRKCVQDLGPELEGPLEQN